MFCEWPYTTPRRFVTHGFQACGAVRAMKHSAQLKVRFCGNCWKEKSVCSSFRLAPILPTGQRLDELRAESCPQAEQMEQWLQFRFTPLC